MTLALDRINSVPLQSDKFSYEFNQWVSNLVDTINNDLSRVESGILSVEVVSGITQQATINSTYIPTNILLTDVRLPVNAPVGARVKIAGFGSGGWALTTNLGQTIHVIAATANTMVASSNRYDCIEVICVQKDTVFVATSSETAGFVIA